MPDVYNATSYGVSSMATMSDFVPTLSVIIVASVAIMLMISYPPIMRKLIRFATFLKKTFGYFFYGVGGSIVLGGLYFFINMNVQQVKSGNPIFLKLVGWTILGYVGLSIFGYLIKRFIVDRIRKSYKKVANENKKKSV